MKTVIRRDSAVVAAFAADCIAQALRENPDLVLGLATGRTVEPVYEQLARHHQNQKLDFSRCRTFSLDEYVGLPAHNRHSFRHFLERHLLSRVNLRPQNIYLLDGSAADPAAESARYERRIAQCGGIDLQLLGIGLNGHIGFNEPPSDLRSRTHVQLLSPVTRVQNAPQFSNPDQVPYAAITLGMATILESRRCLVLVTGEEKAAIVTRALEEPVSDLVPASALQLHRDCTVILDPAAASRLRKTGRVADAVV